MIGDSFCFGLRLIQCLALKCNGIGVVYSMTWNGVSPLVSFDYPMLCQSPSSSMTRQHVPEFLPPPPHILLFGSRVEKGDDQVRIDYIETFDSKFRCLPSHGYSHLSCQTHTTEYIQPPPKTFLDRACESAPSRDAKQQIRTDM